VGSIRRRLRHPEASRLIARLVVAKVAGDVYVQDSAGFRRFEDNLIDDARWQNKDAVLHEI
jgi:hypothetical protein